MAIVATIPKVELVAALRQSAAQARRDRLDGCAAQVEKYLAQVEALPFSLLQIGPVG